LYVSFRLTAGYFSLLRQRKVTKRKANPKAWLPSTLNIQGRYAALPVRFSVFRALVELAALAAPFWLASAARQGDSLDPEIPAMLGGA